MSRVEVWRVPTPRSSHLRQTHLLVSLQGGEVRPRHLVPHTPPNGNGPARAKWPRHGSRAIVRRLPPQ